MYNTTCNLLVFFYTNNKIKWMYNKLKQYIKLINKYYLKKTGQNFIDKINHTQNIIKLIGILNKCL